MTRPVGDGCGPREINLPGSSRSTAPMRPCQSKRCDGAVKQQDGGCQMNPTKWICAECYRNFNQRKMAA